MECCAPIDSPLAVATQIFVVCAHICYVNIRFWSIYRSAEGVQVCGVRYCNYIIIIFKLNFRVNWNMKLNVEQGWSGIRIPDLGLVSPAKGRKKKINEHSSNIP